MFKKTVFSVIVVMLIAGVSFATDPLPGFKLQTEDFSIGALNAVALSGAGGSASNLNTATILQSQQDQLPCSWANQDELVIFIQDASICGVCGGAWAVGQEALVAGLQTQLVGDGCGLKSEAQGLNVGLLQQAEKVDGTGQANAVQNVASVQNQAAGNSAGIMSQNNIVAAGQIGTIAGGPCTDAMIAAGLTVTTSQVQTDVP